MYFYFLIYCWLFFVSCGQMPEISLLGRCGLCLGKCTQCAMTALMRQRVSYFVKWSHPFWDRMKFSHNRKANRQCILWLCMSINFPLCHHVLCKANKVVNDALFVKWFLLECISYVGSHNIIFRCFYTMRFKLNMSPYIQRFINGNNVKTIFLTLKFKKKKKLFKESTDFLKNRQFKNDCINPYTKNHS